MVLPLGAASSRLSSVSCRNSLWYPMKHTHFAPWRQQPASVDSNSWHTSQACSKFPISTKSPCSYAVLLKKSVMRLEGGNISCDSMQFCTLQREPVTVIVVQCFRWFFSSLVVSKRCAFFFIHLCVVMCVVGKRSPASCYQKFNGLRTTSVTGIAFFTSKTAASFPPSMC